jgi:hypothetical protein
VHVIVELVGWMLNIITFVGAVFHLQPLSYSDVPIRSSRAGLVLLNSSANARGRFKVMVCGDILTTIHHSVH